MSTENSPPGTACSVARCPIQLVMRSAFTRWSNTISMGASISIEVAKSGIPLLSFAGCFRRDFQRLQLSRPELRHKISDRCQAVCPDDEEMALAVALLADEAGAAQHAQVVRRDLLRHAEFRCDFPHRARLIPDQGQDPAAVGVGQGMPGDLHAPAKCSRHRPNSSGHLYKCQWVRAGF